MPSTPSVKGIAPFGDYGTWYRVTGDLSCGLPPVVVLHGGPGSTHDYLLSMTALADAGRPVVHYDQLGNGGSTRLPDRGTDFWTVELFRDELDNLLEHLGSATTTSCSGSPGAGCWPPPTPGTVRRGYAVW